MLTIWMAQMLEGEFPTVRPSLAGTTYKGELVKPVESLTFPLDYLFLSCLCIELCSIYVDLFMCTRCPNLHMSNVSKMESLSDCRKYNGSAPMYLCGSTVPGCGHAYDP
jgi:hypothetical protein